MPHLDAPGVPIVQGFGHRSAMLWGRTGNRSIGRFLVKRFPCSVLEFAADARRGGWTAPRGSVPPAVATFRYGFTENVR